MRRDLPDLQIVNPEHMEVHEQLVNWGRWCSPRAASYGSQPMFRLYEPYAVPRESRSTAEVDNLAAQHVQKQMHKLPQSEATALAWYYCTPWVSDGKIMRRLAVNRAGLVVLLFSARTMLRNVLRRAN